MSLRYPARWHDQSGVAMIMTLLVLLVFLTLGAGALLSSSMDLKAANSDQTGHQAFFVAEAGIQDALNRMNRIGVIDFQADIVNRWGTVWGVSSTKAVPGYSSLQYSVQVVATSSTAGTITSTGTGTSKSRRVIQMGLVKGPPGGSPGALYLASDNVTSKFVGNSFAIDGNDHKLDSSIVPGGNVMPGISTRNDGATTEVTGALSDAQKDNVKGSDFSLDPLRPSVKTTNGPGIADLNQMITDLLAKPNVTWSGSSVNGGDTLGTVAVPHITHLTNPDVQVNGNASGAGILIADGSVTINGNFDFTGWIIVRGSTTINSTKQDDGTTVLGSAAILGSLWTGDFKIEVGGNAAIWYSGSAMQLANGTAPGGATPAPMVVTSWQEVY